MSRLCSRVISLTISRWMGSLSIITPSISKIMASILGMLLIYVHFIFSFYERQYGVFCYKVAVLVGNFHIKPNHTVRFFVGFALLTAGFSFYNQLCLNGITRGNGSSKPQVFETIVEQNRAFIRMNKQACCCR